MPRLVLRCFCLRYSSPSALWCFRRHYGASAGTILLPPAICCLRWLYRASTSCSVPIDVMVVPRSVWSFQARYGSSAGAILPCDNLRCHRWHYLVYVGTMLASAGTMALPSALWYFRRDYASPASSTVFPPVRRFFHRRYGGSGVYIELHGAL